MGGKGIKKSSQTGKIIDFSIIQREMFYIHASDPSMRG
jgi:hypothetical protein